MSQMTSSINAPAAQFHPADPPEPEKDDDPTCPHCRRTLMMDELA
jgi:hypothetical protein